MKSNERPARGEAEALRSTWSRRGLIFCFPIFLFFCKEKKNNENQDQDFRKKTGISRILFTRVDGPFASPRSPIACFIFHF